MNKTVQTYDNYERGNSSLGVVMPCFSKEQVIRIVAEFGRTYNTESF